MTNEITKTIAIEMTSDIITEHTFELIADIDRNNNITYTFKENNKAQNMDLRFSDVSIDSLPTIADDNVWNTVWLITDVTDLTHFGIGEIEISE